MQRASESRAAAKKKRKCSKPTTSLEYAACAILVPTPLRTGEGLQCDPGFRGNFRHPFWGPCFRPNFRARTSHTMNLGSSSGLQLECAGPTPQTLDPPRDLSYNARVRHHKPRVLHYSARVRHHKPRVLHYSARVRHHKPRVLLGSSVRVRGSDTPFGFYNVLQQRQANPIYVCDR